MMFCPPATYGAEEATAPAVLFGELEELVNSGFLPNYHLAVVNRKGAVATQSGYYERGVVQVEPLTTRSLVSLLSLSKPITNLLALKLIDDGYLTLDDPLSKYLPQLGSLQVHQEDGTTRRAAADILIKDLLLHTAGFAQNADFLGWGEVSNLYADHGIFGLNCLSSDTPEALAKIVARAATLPLAKEPGEKFAYSIATDVLGRVLEVATGESFASLIADYIAGPLGLSDITFQVSAARVNDVAQLYQPLIKTYPVPGAYQRYEPFSEFATDVVNAGIDLGCISPGVGLMASMNDMVRFAEFLLNGLKLKDGQPFLRRGLSQQVFRHSLDPALGERPLRESLAYAGKDGLSIASLAIRPKKGGDLGTVADHDFYYWSGFSGSGLWVDKSTGTAGVLLTQLYPSDRFLIPKLVAKVRASSN